MQPAFDLLRDKRLLIVDDSLTVTKSLAKILKQAGIKPIECSDGESAIVLAKQQSPDLILLDLIMPQLSGLEVLQQLRQDAALRSIPVIVITAAKEEQSLPQAFEAGAADYISKPFQEPVLLARIFTQLRNRALMSDLERANQELKQAREQEMASARWKTAVEMAGATAHKLNQPLTSIVCYADLLLKKMSLNDEDYKAIKSISEESERMAMILRKMAELTKVRTSEYVGGTTIVDLDRSFEKTDPSILLERFQTPDGKAKK